MENKQTKPKLKWIMGLGLALCLLAVGGAIAFNKWNESASAKFDDYTQELFQEDVVQNTTGSRTMKLPWDPSLLPMWRRGMQSWRT